MSLATLPAENISTKTNPDKFDSESKRENHRNMRGEALTQGSGRVATFGMPPPEDFINHTLHNHTSETSMSCVDGRVTISQFGSVGLDLLTRAAGALKNAADGDISWSPERKEIRNSTNEANVLRDHGREVDD